MLDQDGSSDGIQESEDSAFVHSSVLLSDELITVYFGVEVGDVLGYYFHQEWHIEFLAHCNLVKLYNALNLQFLSQSMHKISQILLTEHGIIISNMRRFLTDPI